jgi:hypothetical protein
VTAARTPMDGQFPHGRPDRQCSATSKQSGLRCRRTASPGRRVCSMHGSRTPVGANAPRFRDGKYSKYLPQRLLADYWRVLADPGMIGLRDEVATIDSRINDVLRRVDTGESGAMWSRLHAAYATCTNAYTHGDAAAFGAAFTALGAAIAAGHEDWEVWADIVDLIDVRRRLVATESARLAALDGLVPIEVALSLVVALSEVVRGRVTDPATRAAIADDVRRFLGPPGDRSPPVTANAEDDESPPPSVVD